MINLEMVSKNYTADSSPVQALAKINLQIEEGEFIVVRGPSGSGKTTLLLTIGGMLHPSSGKVSIDGQNIYEMSGKSRAKFRALKIGFVFQMFHLLPYLNCRENIILQAQANRRMVSSTEADVLLKRFGIFDRARHKPSELSIGEKQRTALARAMLNNPEIILADEPTGNLDPENAKEVFRYLSEFHKINGTVVLVTHGDMADQYADRIVQLKSGQLIES